MKIESMNARPRRARRAPDSLVHKAKRAAIESGPFELRTKTGQLFERKLALHLLCMDMACIPKRLKFMADLAQTMTTPFEIVN